MNEQDIINRIEKEANDLPIPESISPSNMEKMLNEKVKDQDYNSEHATDSIDNTSSVIPFRKRIGLAIAACFGVIIIGSGALTLLKNNSSDKSASDEAVTYEAAQETAGADEAYEEDAQSEDTDADDDSSPDTAAENEDEAKNDNVAAEADDSEESDNIKNNLASSSNISKPESYDDYYDTVYYAYLESSRNRKKALGEFRSFDAEETLNESTAIDSQSDSGIANSESSKSSSDKSYSSTNTQEKNVDEGDIVKTDGEYIYTAHGSDYYTIGQSQQPFITITKASKGKLTKVSSIPLFDDINTQNDTNCILNEFYLYNNRLIVLYGKSSKISGNNYYLNYESKTVIDIYDISNKSNIRKISSQSQSGTFDSSRISDGHLYTVSRFYIDNTIFGNYKDGKENLAGYIPYINDQNIDCDDIFYSRHLDNMNTFVITSLNLSRANSFSDAKSISCSGSEMYVSDNAIYLYGSIYDDIEKTEILRIEYRKGTMNIGNRAVIAGRLYDSFALSEYNDHLRIVATIPANNFAWYSFDAWTDAALSDPGITVRKDINSVYVLDNEMKMTGKITGLAPGEQIYSARFFGDIGYFVTYRNTDPLFSVDFSDPENPTILGELKIPGFSNYLHFYGNNTLLGIGEERDPYTQNLDGLKLSMFNIEDPTNVVEADRLVLHNVYYSSAQYNHKSIMIDPEKNIFGFCYEMEGYDETGDYSYNYYYSTFSYDPKEGFYETARYKINYDYMYDLEDVRGVFIDDYFYLVSPTEITSYVLSSDEQIDNIILN